MAEACLISREALWSAVAPATAFEVRVSLIRNDNTTGELLTMIVSTMRTAIRSVVVGGATMKVWFPSHDPETVAEKVREWRG